MGNGSPSGMGIPYPTFHVAPYQALKSPNSSTDVTVTLEFINCRDDAKDFQVERDLGLGLGPRGSSPPSGPFPDPEQHAAGTETVSTHRVAVWVLGPEVELKPLGRVSVDLQQCQRRHGEW